MRCLQPLLPLVLLVFALGACGRRSLRRGRREHRRWVRRRGKLGGGPDGPTLVMVDARIACCRAASPGSRVGGGSACAAGGCCVLGQCAAQGQSCGALGATCSAGACQTPTGPCGGVGQPCCGDQKLCTAGGACGQDGKCAALRRGEHALLSGAHAFAGHLCRRPDMHTNARMQNAAAGPAKPAAQGTRARPPERVPVVMVAFA
jgi:hypothetical protein